MKQPLCSASPSFTLVKSHQLVKTQWPVSAAILPTAFVLLTSYCCEAAGWWCGWTELLTKMLCRVIEAAGWPPEPLTTPDMHNRINYYGHLSITHGTTKRPNAIYGLMRSHKVSNVSRHMPLPASHRSKETHSHQQWGWLYGHCNITALTFQWPPRILTFVLSLRKKSGSFLLVL